MVCLATTPFTDVMDTSNRIDHIYAGVKAVGLCAIGLVYFIYLMNYANYELINEGFYFPELWFAAAAISGALLFVSIADHVTTPREARGWRLYRAFIIGMVLTSVFYPFALGISLVDFLVSY